MPSPLNIICPPRFRSEPYPAKTAAGALRADITTRAQSDPSSLRQPGIPAGLDVAARFVQLEPPRGPQEDQQTHDVTPAMGFCDSVTQWLGAWSSGYRGLCVRRPGLVGRDLYQHAAQQLIESYDGQPLYLAECMDFEHLHHTPGGVRTEALKAASEMLDGLKLPLQLISQMKRDAVDLCEVMFNLFPKAQHADLKLESFGEKDRCGRWHRDDYVARAFVCYCGAGTLYTEDSNVDFLALESPRGVNQDADNEKTIKNPSDVKSIDAGDMLLIKGLRYGLDDSGGLVHMSPQPEFYPDGRVKYRLALKVDLTKFSEVPKRWTERR